MFNGAPAPCPKAIHTGPFNWLGPNAGTAVINNARSGWDQGRLPSGKNVAYSRCQAEGNSVEGGNFC